MNLHIHSKILRLTRDFNIYDDSGQIHFYAKGERSWAKTICVYDSYNNEIAKIQNRFGIQPSRFITIMNNQYTLLTKPSLPPNFFCFLKDTNIVIKGKKIMMGKRSFRIPKYWVYLNQECIMYFEQNQSKNVNHLLDEIFDLHIIDPQHKLMCVCIALALSW